MDGVGQGRAQREGRGVAGRIVRSGGGTGGKRGKAWTAMPPPYPRSFFLTTFVRHAVSHDALTALLPVQREGLRLARVVHDDPAEHWRNSAFAAARSSGFFRSAALRS